MVAFALEWKLDNFYSLEEAAMGQPQVQERKAMLIQEVQQLKSANVPKAEAFNRLNAQGKTIPASFLKYYNLEEVPSGKSLKENRKTESLDVEPFKTEITHVCRPKRQQSLKVSSIYDCCRNCS